MSTVVIVMVDAVAVNVDVVVTTDAVVWDVLGVVMMMGPIVVCDLPARPLAVVPAHNDITTPIISQTTRRRSERAGKECVR